MHAAVQSGLLEQTHRYREVRGVHIGDAASKLDRGAFHCEVEPSVPADCIVGPKVEAPYFSPAAENMGLPFADAVVIREALRAGDGAVFGQCWQGFWCSAAHQLCFQVVDGDRVEVDWHVALSHFSDSGCVAAPVRIESPPGAENHRYVVFLPDMPRVLCLADMQKVRAFRLGWRSWSWQLQRFPSAVSGWRPAVRAFQDGEVEPVLAIAARAGWWCLGRGIMDKVAAHLCVDVPAGADLFQVLLSCTTRVLSVSEEAALEFLSERLSTMKRRNKNYEELLCIDEAAACLDAADQAEVRQEQEAAQDRRHEEERFRASYREKRGSVRAAGAKTAAQKKAAGRVWWKGPKKLPPRDQTISHAQAKLLMPPGPPTCYLWRANHQGAWYSRVGGMPACSRSDAAHGGEDISLRLVIQDAWSTWLALQGFAPEACPIEGMWEVWQPRSAAPGTAAASSAGTQ